MFYRKMSELGRFTFLVEVLKKTLLEKGITLILEKDGSP